MEEVVPKKTLPEIIIQPLGRKFRNSNVDIDKKQVLIIEDDDGMRSLLKDFMEDEGFKTQCAADAFEAFPKIEAYDFDLIISDIRMPGPTGLDILPKMRKLQPNAYIVLITAFGSQETDRKSIDRGANVCWEKPVRFDQLKTLATAIGSSKN